MKKIILFGLFVILMCGLVIAQPPVPNPVTFFITVNGESVGDGVIVKVTNMGTGEDLIRGLNTHNGGVTFDLSEFEQGYRFRTNRLAGDSLKVTCDVSVLCSEEFVIGQTPFIKTLEVNDVNIKYVCFDGSEVEKKSDCPVVTTTIDTTTITPTTVVPTTTPVTTVVTTTSVTPTTPLWTTTTTEKVVVITKIFCEDGSEVFDPVDCPKKGFDWLVVGVVALLGLAGGAAIFFKLFNNFIFTGSRTGVKTYRGRDGKLKLFHKHPGTTGYHSPDVVHRKPENHPKGMIDVGKGYVKNSRGLWEYKG